MVVSDQYVIDRLMGNGAREMVVAFICCCMTNRRIIINMLWHINAGTQN